MPFYTYRCPQCENLQDIKMTIKEYSDLMAMPRPVVCTNHDEPVLMVRKLSPPAITIK